MTTRDNVREFLENLLRERGLNFSEVSRAIGRNHAYLQQYMSRGIPAELPEKVRASLADFLGVAEERLTPPRATDLLQKTRKDNSGPLGEIKQNATLAGGVRFKHRIPAYGQAMGGKDGAFVLNGNKLADVLAPPSLEGVIDAYAVFVAGESMEPRYFAGEVVFVNPHLPVRKGDFVVVQIADNDSEPPRGYIKRFVSKDDRKIRLEQFNPEKIIEFRSAAVASVHRIVMGGDG